MIVHILETSSQIVSTEISRPHLELLFNGNIVETRGHYTGIDR